jgi:hypothetical protein
VQADSYVAKNVFLRHKWSLGDQVNGRIVVDAAPRICQRGAR